MYQQYNQKNQVKFCYELLSELTIHQKQVCYAITFNQNKQLVLVCCDLNIKVYQFNDGYLKLISILSKSRFTITVLSFFKNNRKCQFLSGSCDSFIEVRSITQLRSQKYTQKLDSHKNGINCLVIGQDQNMFLSGCVGQAIKLWSCFQQNQRSCQWSCQQTITDHTNSVYTLDINSKQNKAVSCGYDDTMLIMDIIKNMETYQLVLKQKIKLPNFSYRILFINDSDFIFQSYSAKFLQLFQQDQNEKYFITYSLPVQCKSQPCNIFFQPQFIQSKGYFVCKNSQNLNFVYHNPVNNELVLLYSIYFDNYEQYGSLSEDGEYLITWNQKLEQIEIRKYKLIDDKNN
ncbi:unnamed protein product (macronuclear) [Paramecium tetraurelia]|uniref:Uncharacterized protein n=1 Tax=Paramecium tetraurelia TaxID=5888 RepID=A0BWG1_PARTE|nr:uncharacterized protein GSPATT00032730001 [Paramecium tetraurelia]CAK62878.1 unnamed protein product [Paramecium tetraurelia]|eukprot:XP_001430276.1 hypothetical protein (macronuclear) [Paramecium tetraurelia strain d4-2]